MRIVFVNGERSEEHGDKEQVQGETETADNAESDEGSDGLD